MRAVATEFQHDLARGEASVHDVTWRGGRERGLVAAQQRGGKRGHAEGYSAWPPSPIARDYWPRAAFTAFPSSVYESAESSAKGRITWLMRPSGPTTKSTRRRTFIAGYFTS